MAYVRANVLNLGDVYSQGEAIKGARRRNALYDQQFAEQEKLNALMADPNTTPDQFARAGRSDIGNALVNNEASKRQAFMQLAEVAQKLLTIQDPQQRRAAAEQAQRIFEPQFRATGAQGGNLAAVSDQQLERALQSMAALAPQAKQGEGFSLSQGQTRFDANGNPIASVAAAPEKPKPRFRPLTPQEVQAAGLPPGTSAQVNEENGQINVLSKRDATGGLSQKDATTAKMKLNTVKLARKQLANIRAKFGAIKGTAQAGPFGQGRLPTPKGKAFDKAVDIMRSTLTSLTRVPGVGAMSDYETRLDQAKFPERIAYEEVTDDNIAQLDNMLNAIERGYSDLLSGAEIAPNTVADEVQTGVEAAGGWSIQPAD